MLEPGEDPLGTCRKCGEGLSLYPHWSNLFLHKHCLEANKREVERRRIEARERHDRESSKARGR